MTGQGVVCFISNYSWLDGLSFTGMRERYLEAFDAVRIDCLNGDKYKTGKTTPEGAPDPSIFSTAGDPVGIQVGTAIATLVRQADHTPAQFVEFRHLWGQSKHGNLTATAEAERENLYTGVVPVLSLGLPFADLSVLTADSEKPSDASHRWRRTRAMASTKVGDGLSYQAALRWVIGRCFCSEWAARVVQEKRPSRTGVVRAMARSDHWRWVSTPRWVRTS